MLLVRLGVEDTLLLLLLHLLLLLSRAFMVTFLRKFGWVAATIGHISLLW